MPRETSSKNERMLLILIFGFGCSPLWITTLFVIYIYLTMGNESGGMALWYFLAAIPTAFITTIIALATLEIKERTKGDENKKNENAWSFFFIAVTILLIVIAIIFL